MSHTAVSFELQFPARRQLQSVVQTSLVEPSSEAFQQRLRAAVASSFTPARPESDVVVTTTIDPRVLRVAIVVGVGARAITSSQAVAVATSSSFLTGLESHLGSSIRMHVAPAVAVLVTAAPPPPPSTPPSAATPSLATAASDNLATAVADDSKLSTEMMWVVIASSIILVVACGCAVAFFLGKRSAKNKARNGRPALRRSTSKEEQPRHQQPPSLGVSARPEDVRLLELGMAIERAQGNYSTHVPYTHNVSPKKVASPKPAAKDVALKLDSVQVAIDNVRESLSPHAELSPRLVRLHDTRIRASAALE